ncbi:hypothetical protein [Noviherbaspirillum sp.]|uniref:hypothetical protein n=1 Tax=Noviherbaspirillum sp. TaxID=1926288 RepID=UPI002B473A44|nr:hypothetical protein [Noviherbaspirillum sp.]HJV82058.1 hypothetical protein [Noviherbaspirillum sp.]
MMVFMARVNAIMRRVGLKSAVYCGTNSVRQESRQIDFRFPLERLMARQQLINDELAALRNLEAAVRACGLPTIMVSGQQQLDSLADALKAVEEVRRLAAQSTAQISPVQMEQH